MAADLGFEAAHTGREIKEDGTIVNTADLMNGWTDKSGGLRTFDELQSAVHDGMMFSYTNHGTIAAAGTLMLLGVTGNRQVHFDGFSIDISQGPFLVEFFEAPTVTTLGTPVTTRRRNRNNPNVSQMLVYSGGTVSATGLLLADDQLLLVGLGANVLSGTSSVSDGWVLKANTTYLIRLTNQAGTTTSYNARFSWHEANYTV